jgi:hypothetical protein
MKKSIFHLFCFAAAGMVFTSCLKDKNVENEVYGIIYKENNVVMIPGPPDDAVIVNLELNVADDTTFNIINVQFAGGDVAKEDINVTIALNPALVTSYNAVNGTTYDPNMPSTAYTLGSGASTISVKIPKGGKSVGLPIKLKPSVVATGNYAFGFTISAVDKQGVLISSNAKNAIIALGAKNEFDGIYQMRSFFAHPTNPALVGGVYNGYFMVSAGARSVDACINIGSLFPSQLVFNGAAPTYFTGVNPRLNIALNGDVTLAKAVGTSVDFLQSAAEASVSKYYPTGIPGFALSNGRKTIVAHFRWNAAGGDRVARDTFIYIQPR